MRSFILIILATVATSQAQELEADFDENLVASVKGKWDFLCISGSERGVW